MYQEIDIKLLIADRHFKGKKMLNWIRCHAVGLLKASFATGGFCAALVAFMSLHTGEKLLTLGSFVGACALVVTLLARVTIACAKKFMAVSLLPMRWDELTTSQFFDIGLAARIAFIAQNFGLFIAAFGFGWIFLTMFLLLIGNK